MPSVKMERASTVAVVVPSPATSEVLEATSLTICAPMFSNLSSSSISLATVTPSLVTVGAPKLFSRTTLRPLGPSVTVTASARTLTPRRIFSRASCEKRTNFAPIAISWIQWEFERRGGRSPFEHAQNVVFAQNQVIFALELHLAARILAEQNAVARLHVGCDKIALFGPAALADRDYLAFLRLFLRGVGNDNPALGLVLFLDTLHQNPIA